MKESTDFLKPILESQIRRLEERIEELRLEHLPNVAAIRDIQENIEKMRKGLADLNAEEVPYAPA